jgi:hypothetical protein
MGNSCVRKIYAVGSFPTPTPNYGVSTLGKAVWGPVPAKAGDPVNLYFDKAPASSSCQVYNLAGDKVLSASFDGPSASLQTGHLAPGIYAVRAVVNYQDGSTQTMFQKIVITK